MEVILKADVPKLGKMMDVVNVKKGYATNFLFPRKLAILATKQAKEQIETNRAALEAQFRKDHSVAEQMAAKLAEASVTLSRRVVEDERLYGSVSAADISEALKAQGFKIDKNQVDLDEAIKQLGVYTVSIRVFSGIEVPVKVWVVKED